jgi:hypothetical protein
MSYFIPNWRAGMQAVSAAIDQSFGERLTLIACLARPNFPTEPDASIKPVALQGVFSLRSELAFKSGGSPGRGEAPGLIESRKPVASFSHADLPWQINRGDRVKRETTGEMYEVTRVEPDGVSRVTLHLVELGKAEL